MVENTWSTSIKIMYGLHRETHRYFIEPVCEKPHIKKLLAQRFINFTLSIKKSKKVALSKIFEEVRNDCLSFTGSNLRQLMILMDKGCIEDLEPRDIFETDFSKIPVQEAWRIPIVKELIDLKTGEMVLPGDGLSSSQLTEILDALTTE